MQTTVFDLLDFPKRFQAELIRHLILDPNFMRHAATILKVSDFDYPPCQTVYDALLSFWRSYKQLPAPTVLDTIVADFCTNGGRESVAIRPEEQPAFYEFWLGIRMQYAAPLSTEYFKQELIRYIQNARFNGILASAQQGGHQGIRHALKEAQELKQLEGQMTAGAAVFTDAWRDHVPTTVENYIRIPTGLRKLDWAIDNGLGLGEMGLVMACPGVGKTNTMLNFASQAAIAGYRALFLTFELSKHRIEQRYQAISANIYAKSLRRPAEYWSTEEMARWHFCRTHMPPNGVTVYDFSNQRRTPIEAVDSVIKQWKQAMIERYQALAMPLLVCVDWLHPSYITVGHSRDASEHEIVAALAKELNAVARENKVALWSACQGNRGADGKLQLEMKDAAGAYAVSQPIDVGIGVAPIRDPTQRQTVNLTRAGEDDDSAAGGIVQDGRMLHIASFKNRDNMPFSFEAFQGPTLRLFTTKAEWTGIERNMQGTDGIAQIKEDLGIKEDEAA